MTTLKRGLLVRLLDTDTDTLIRCTQGSLLRSCGNRKFFLHFNPCFSVTAYTGIDAMVHALGKDCLKMAGNSVATYKFF